MSMSMLGRISSSCSSDSSNSGMRRIGGCVGGRLLPVSRVTAAAAAVHCSSVTHASGSSRGRSSMARNHIITPTISSNITVTVTFTATVTHALLTAVTITVAVAVIRMQ